MIVRETSVKHTDGCWQDVSVLHNSCLWTDVHYCIAYTRTSFYDSLLDLYIALISIIVICRCRQHRICCKRRKLWNLTINHACHNLNRFTACFPGPPGWAGARRELLDFMVQGEINRGRHTDHPAGCNSMRTNQCPPPPSPIFFYGPDALPATQPTVSKHWRQLAHLD